MPSYNKVLLIGHLTRDPQLKHLPSGSSVTEFGIANNRKFKTGAGEEREEVCFVDCTAFGKTGEIINQHFSKGKPIFVEGRLKYDTWEDRQTGAKRSKLTVAVDNFQFIGGRDDAGGGGQYPATRSSLTSKPKPSADDVFSPSGLDESEIPFRWEGRRQQQV